MDKKLAKEVLRQVERAYRRGYQQGYHAATSQSDPPTAEQVFNFRYKTPLSKDYTAPRNSKHPKSSPLSGSLIKRFTWECDTVEAAELSLYLKKQLNHKD